jgi:hypothetical protein
MNDLKKAKHLAIKIIKSARNIDDLSFKLQTLGVVCTIKNDEKCK